jgi:hypothetical protein
MAGMRLSIEDLGFSRAELERGDPDLGDLEVLLQASGIEVKWFLRKHMVRGSIQLSPETLVMGGLSSIRAALRTMARSMPDAEDYPSALLPFLRRRVWPSTLAEARDAVEQSGRPLFVKPRLIRKRFTGAVLSGPHQWPLSQVSGRTEVWCSDVVHFQSEARAFVHRPELVEIRHYWGDPVLAPDEATVVSMIQSLGDNSPAGYALDVGILDDGSTALIEMTDGFSLDRYGLSATAYLAVVSARWRELVGVT